LEAPLKNISVLVVEDDDDTRTLLSIVLRAQGASVTHATNGVEGYERALHEAPDVVVMDTKMPRMDGNTAVAKLRGEGFAKPVLGLSADAMTGRRELSIRAGMNEFLAKPFAPASLVAAVRRLAGAMCPPGRELS
jgi:CheY-like chemotaxis protein